jgi:transposase
MCKEDPTCSRIEELAAANKKLADENTSLKDRIAWFERQVFGQKKERFVADSDVQMQLALDGVTPQPKPATTETVTYRRTKTDANKTPHGREDFPAHLPRVRILIPADFDTTGMEKIGEKITEELHYEPPVFEVKQLVREVFATTSNGVRTALCVDMPPRCIDKGKADSSVIAHVITAKCVDHMPLYRIAAQIKRDSGFEIAESTLNNWFERGSFWLSTIANELQRRIFAGTYVQMDESTLRVMIQPTGGKSSLGCMWVATSPEQKLVLFTYNKSHGAKIARRLIPPEFSGVVQTDGLDVYGWIDAEVGMIHAGCHAHSRRGFDESLTNDKDRAAFALSLYRELFAVEREAMERNFLPDERLALRKERSLPLMNRLHSWCSEEIKKLRPKDKISKAIAYTLNQWNCLTRFLEDGRIEISNNIVENVIRPLALGRKNWLFAGSEEGARRLAIMYSVLGTCKLLGVNPFRYISHVLEELPKRKANDIEDLLPMNWKDRKISDIVTCN